MTRDDILRMAQEAGLALAYSETDEDGWQKLERFAVLVAAANEAKRESKKITDWGHY